jgi:hypothetical protein
LTESPPWSSANLTGTLAARGFIELVWAVVHEHNKRLPETANLVRQLVLPKSIRGWTLTTLREKLIKIGAKMVAHPKYVTFQLAEVAIPRRLFARILERIARLCPACASG